MHHKLVIVLLDLVNTLRDFKNDSELYADLIFDAEKSITIVVELTDTGQTATLILEKETGVSSIEKGGKKGDLKVTMTTQTLHDIAEGEADAFALAGRSSMDEKRPIDFEFLNPARSAEAMEAIKGLATYFFVPGRLKNKELRVEQAGQAHGARPIPLVYWNALRTAWYHVDTGTVLNEEREIDPWPQAFIVLDGKGKIVIDDETIEMEKNRIYYVPRSVVHQIEARTDVQLIWLAWDAK
ncbi:MAG: cupin domain-containing protein [Candidatus Lokiarchaeota archaeon]|nr:cupin domain-containing protein [Candidatus Lokiarchaeota archaeon]